MALHGGSIQATNWCSICTSSPLASGSRCVHRSACTSPTGPRPNTRCWSNSKTITRSISRLVLRDFPIADDFRLPLDADVLAIYPHAHYLGKLLEASATLPDGSRKWLIRIPTWDSNWQAVYYYREPVFLPKDSVIHMRYHYDNSAANPRNPNHPPKRVRAGNQATDEMGHLWLQILPRGAGDHRRELQEAVMRHRLEKDPHDVVAHMNLGAILLSRLDPQAAVTELRAAERLEPNRPEVHNMLGLGLAALNRNADAIAQYQLALRSRPDYASARFNLATALAKSGRIDEAVTNLRQVLAANPDDVYAKQRLAALLATHPPVVQP